MRGHLYLSVLLLLAAAQFAIAGETRKRFLDSGTKRPFDVTRHSVPVEELRGGLARDGIPAIDHPKFVSAKQAGKFLSGQDRVLAVDLNGVAKAYPIKVLNWHEIVNDKVNGRPITVTW